MLNVNGIWSVINKTLNLNLKILNNEYKFIKANTIHNLPPYPYCVTNPSVPYIEDRDDFRGTITHKYTSGTQTELTRTTEPKMNFSLTFYSNKYDEVFKFMQDTSNFLEFQGKQEFAENDIILLGCTLYVDKTSILEVDYVYKYGFDLQIRVKDKISYNVDIVDKVYVENKNSIETIEIEGGN